MKPGNSSSSQNSALYTFTESVKFHQDHKSKLHQEAKNRPHAPAKSAGQPNQPKVKALASCQLGSGHKCRSSAVKLSPSSAMAQENIAVPKIGDKKRNQDSSQNDKSKRLKYSSKSSSQRNAKSSSKFKLCLKQCQNDDIGSTPDDAKYRMNPSVCDNDEFRSINSDSTTVSKSRLPSSLVTSTESITCTVIDRNGRKSVTSPQCIRLVDKILPNKEGSDFSGFKNNCLASPSFSMCPSPLSSNLFFPSSCGTGESPSELSTPCDASLQHRNTSTHPKTQTIEKIEEASQDYNDINLPDEDHQKEVSKLFDQLFAFSAANSSQEDEKNASSDGCEGGEKTSHNKIRWRRHSFVKLFKQHGLHLSTDELPSPDFENQQRTDSGTRVNANDDDATSDQPDLSRAYDWMRETFKSVR